MLDFLSELAVSEKITLGIMLAGFINAVIAIWMPNRMSKLQRTEARKKYDDESRAVAKAISAELWEIVLRAEISRKRIAYAALEAKRTSTLSEASVLRKTEYWCRVLAPELIPQLTEVIHCMEDARLLPLDDRFELVKDRDRWEAASSSFEIARDKAVDASRDLYRIYSVMANESGGTMYDEFRSRITSSSAKQS